MPVAGLIALAVGWSGLWYFGASEAQTMLVSWRAREANRGHVYSCADETVSGFPFRMQVRCTEPAAELRDLVPALAIHARDLLAVAQVYDPMHVVAEATGPVTAGGRAGAPIFTANWARARASVRGRPSALETISVAFDRLAVTRQDGGAAQTAGAAEHLEVRLAEAPRLPQDPPAIDLALRLSRGTLPEVGQLADPAVDADISAELRGLHDVSAKPWRERLRELQAANGRLEIKPSRVQQGDIIAVGQGTLALTPDGRLDGEIRLTVAGLEQLVTKLGLDQAVGRASQNAADRILPGINLDRLLGPRGNAALAAVGMSMLGKPADLEGRRAVTLPLRFSDGDVFLGPLPVGRMPPLF